MSIQHVSLRQLRVFESAATHKSFSKAAEILHLTQPGVSMHIKELETSVGLPLFERIGRKLYVTEAGKELLARAREILRALKDAEDTLDGLRGLRRGRINLAVVSTAKYFVPQLLAQFGKDFPELEIRLTVNNRDSVIDQLVANEVDLAIMGRSPQSLDTVAEPFANNPHVIIAAPDHELAGQRRIKVETMAKQKFIVREPGSGTREAVELALLPHLENIQPAMTLGSSEAIKNAAAEGLGISCLSRSAVEDLVSTGRLCVLETRVPPLTRRLALIHHRAKVLSETIRRFLQYCESHRVERTVPTSARARR